MVGRYHKGDFTKGMLFLGACTCMCICFYKAGVFKNQSIQRISSKISTLKYSKLLCVMGVMVLVLCPMGLTAAAGREYLAWVIGGVFGAIYFVIFGDAIDANDLRSRNRAARLKKEGNSKGRKSQGTKRAMSAVHKKQDNKIKGKKKL